MLERRILHYIKTHKLLEPGEKLLAGVSGGPDSLALLHFLANLRGDYGIQLYTAHVDHMFRGRESYEDLLFVKDACRALDIAFEGKSMDVNAYREETGLSPQNAARVLRYQFYREVMDKYGIRKLALGHHGDDQIETILMRLTRGASGFARAGIAVKRRFHEGEIIRPFLAADKEEILDYCRRHGLNPRMDPSNEKGSYSRNRFRISVLPFLKRENIKAHEHFQRFSEETREDEELLLDLARTRMESVWVKKDRMHSAIRIQALAAMPNSLQRRGIQLILNYLYGENPESLSAKHITQVKELLLNPDPSAELHFPNNLLVKKSYDLCMFSFLQAQPKPYSVKLKVPGVTQLPNGYCIEAQFVDRLPESRSNSTFLIRKGGSLLPLHARTRLNGDRMLLKGLKGGSKKIKDLFINEKTPAESRDSWPIVTDASGEILWVPGIRKSSWEAEYCDNEHSYIYLEYIKV
ncbi:tRNA lysidine(34) synthetase TilS [Peribacillus sp. SCS-26]|uniref:tRNA lysidine(34) synthetase TilS n=1 Tax=Paraperibacillus marinus TaxID=3115295 RepID=UPI0039069F5D